MGRQMTLPVPFQTPEALRQCTRSGCARNNCWPRNRSPFVVRDHYRFGRRNVIHWLAPLFAAQNSSTKSKRLTFSIGSRLELLFESFGCVRFCFGERILGIAVRC